MYSTCVYMCTCIQLYRLAYIDVCVYIYIYIYIYRERERGREREREIEREREREMYTHTCIHMMYHTRSDLTNQKLDDSK